MIEAAGEMEVEADEEAAMENFEEFADFDTGDDAREEVASAAENAAEEEAATALDEDPDSSADTANGRSRRRRKVSFI